MKNDEVFYQLSIADIQTVAKEQYGRKLSAKEIKKIIEHIENSIPWYDIIDDCICVYLSLKRVDSEYDQLFSDFR